MAALPDVAARAPGTIVLGNGSPNGTLSCLRTTDMNSALLTGCGATQLSGPPTLGSSTARSRRPSSSARWIQDWACGPGGTGPPRPALAAQRSLLSAPRRLRTSPDRRLTCRTPEAATRAAAGPQAPGTHPP